MAGKYPTAGELTAIFDQFASPIYQYVVRLCHDPAVGDTVVGDAFAQLLEEFIIGKGPPLDLRLYLYQTAHKFILKYLHDRQHYPVLPVVITSGEITAISSPSRDDERTMEEALFSALHNEITEDQRYVMSLYFLEDFSIKDTAKILGKKVNEIGASLRDIQKVMDNHPELPTESLTKKKRKPK